MNKINLSRNLRHSLCSQGPCGVVGGDRTMGTYFKGN